MPDIRVHPDLDSLSAAAAEVIVEKLGCAQSDHSRATIALSGGSTPRKLYANLGRHPWRERIDWPRLHVFVVDERFVPPEDDESNQRMIRETLLATSPLPGENFHPIPFIPYQPERAAREYEQELVAFFGRARVPAFDVALMGMGPDGHTASLFPGTRAVEIKDHWVAATMNPAGPSQRITLTLPVINAARTVIYLITGADKSETLRMVIEEKPTAFPTAHVQPTSGELIWLLDKAAASKLQA
jgi:6-phosphogluconolactonase